MKTNITNTLGKASFIFALSSFLFISCDQQEVESFDSQKDTPITIASASVAELTTRVITEEGHLIGRMGEPVAMSVWVEGSGDNYNAKNIEWINDGGNYWYTNNTVLYAGENKQKIYALYPYCEGATEDGKISINATEQADYLIAKQNLIDENPIHLTMRHAFAKLSLMPTFGTEAGGLEIVSIEVKNMYASGTLNIKEDTWTYQGEATATLAMTNHEVLVIPMEVCESFPIVITMNDGRVFKATISLAAVGNELKSNSQYKISLQIGQDKVTVGNITAAPWVAENGGNLETE
ncbi:fimbrillin family protein [Bacteroides xylanisolvens]|uniref:fimbrillin family protein n=1 Tax=Bacteroides xylanisolvens TaxID=371601 RepID=UPI0039B6022C